MAGCTGAGHSATVSARTRYLASSHVTVTLFLHVLDPLWHKGRSRIKSVSGGEPQSAPHTKTGYFGDHVADGLLGSW